MYISFTAPVFCSDGHAGWCLRIMIDPAGRRLTHIVVADKLLVPGKHLVPFEQIAGTSVQLIQLRCSKEELRRMPEFLESGYQHDPSRAARSKRYPGGRPVLMPLMPRGVNAVIEDMSVETRDRRVGRLTGLEVNGKDGRIRYLMLEKDYLQEARERACPAEQIESISAGSIYLKEAS